MTGHCVGQFTLNDFEEFMLNTTSSMNEFSDDASFLELGDRSGTGKGSGSGSAPLGYARAVGYGGVTITQLCVDIQVPVSGITVQVVLDGVLKTGSGPLYNAFDVTAKVAAVVGWGWLKGSIEVKGKVSLEATDCRGWKQVVEHWTAAVLKNSLESDEIKAMAKDDAKKKELQAFHDKLGKLEEKLIEEYKNADKAGGKKAMAGMKVGVVKLLSQTTMETIAATPGICTMSWSAGVTVGISAGGTEGCGNFPWVFIEGGYSWGQDIVAGKVEKNRKVAGGTVRITPICQQYYCFQVSASYDTKGDLALTTYIHLPADTSVQGSFPKMIWDQLWDQKNEAAVAKSLGSSLVGFKNAVTGGGANAAKILAEGQVDGLLANKAGVGGPAASLVAAMIFKSLEALKQSVTDAKKDFKGKDGVTKKVKEMCADFFKALGKNIVDMIKGSKQDFKEFLLKSVGVTIQDNLAFEITFRRNAKGEKTLEGTVQALKVMSVGTDNLPIKIPSLKVNGVYLQGRGFDLFGSQAMHAEVWSKLFGKKSGFQQLKSSLRAGYPQFKSSQYAALTAADKK
jgi:hypothetical protein